MSVLSTEAALFYILTNDAGVSALISNRAYPHAVPQTATAPYVFYEQTSGEYPSRFSGSSGLALKQFSVSGEASTAMGRNALAEAVRAGLHGYSGTVTVGGVSIEIQMCDCMTDDETYVLESEGGDDVIYGFTQTYQIAHATE